MFGRRFHTPDGERAVLISLTASVGMIILTIVGLWMWKILARIAEAMFNASPIEIP
ncbi:MAG: hypothetical protein AB1411_03200 [Nitrospirota bacterium]